MRVIPLSLPMVICMIIFIHPSNGEANKLLGWRKLGMGKMMRSNDNIVIVNENRYAVVFDAGSSGSRVHVYCFDPNLDLVPFAHGLELFVHTEPGLSAYADDPEEAASSLVPLLERAENAIPKELHGDTPVKLGATAGLRMLPGDAPEKILQAVKDLLKDKSDLVFNPDWVTVLDGTQEGAFLWVAVNYLLGKLGNEYSQTVGVVDLGGGSVQLAYAISESTAAKAPNVTEGQEAYVKNMYLKDRKYHLYVHSYLNYGLLAARAEILKTIEKSENPCVLAGYHGSYTYGGVTYEVSASPSGGQFDSCREYVLTVLNVNQTCSYMQCSFGGVWNGGGGDGQKSMYVASFFYDRAAQAGFIDSNKTVVTVKPSDFMEAAKLACETNLEVAKSKYAKVEENDLPYLCMDLVYQYSLLVDGFGLDSSQTITLVKRVPYQNSLVEAAWPLGSAIDVMSSLTRPRIS